MCQSAKNHFSIVVKAKFSARVVNLCFFCVFGGIRILILDVLRSVNGKSEKFSSHIACWFIIDIEKSWNCPTFRMENQLYYVWIFRWILKWKISRSDDLKINFIGPQGRNLCVLFSYVCGLFLDRDKILQLFCYSLKFDLF